MAILTLALQHTPFLSLALASHPNAAVVIGTLGCALIFWEFNRPGRIIPAASGLLLLLLATAGLIAAGVQLWAFALLVLGATGLLFNAWLQLPVALLVMAVATLITGLCFLLPRAAPVPIHLFVALSCGSVLGLLSASLTRIAYRARRAKALD